jgi:hypothetical protein
MAPNCAKHMPHLYWKVMNLKNVLSLFSSLQPVLFLFFVPFFGAACASAQKSDQHLLRKIILYNLHYRRPSQMGARFSAERLDLDYESHPKPDPNLDCEPLKSLFAGVDLSTFRQCLAAVNEESKENKIVYKLNRAIKPFLELVENEQTPACLLDVLPILPVPREIYFQALEGERLSCFNSRISIAAEDVLGTSTVFHGVQLDLTFPLAALPEGDAETLLLLGTWAVTSFFDERGYLQAKIVPRSLCASCFGGKGLFLESDPLPPFWP